MSSSNINLCDGSLHLWTDDRVMSSGDSLLFDDIDYDSLTTEVNDWIVTSSGNKSEVVTSTCDEVCPQETTNWNPNRQQQVSKSEIEALYIATRKDFMFLNN
jgi:hypothetical protein